MTSRAARSRRVRIRGFMLEEKTMRVRFGRSSLAGAVAFAVSTFTAGAALAHHPEIGAEAVCDPATGLVSINYISTSWFIGEPGGGNPQIDILFNGVKVDEGAYAAPSYSFSGSQPAPALPSVTVTAFAAGLWSDGSVGGQSASVVVEIPPGDCVAEGLGRFTGGGHQVRVGAARVTRGLTIHCDLLLSNNLEVNWGGNQFHMTEHLLTVACTDDPAITQAPPAAPLDTLVGVGTGRYNGSAGYTIEFTLVDAGEPGGNDQAALLIYETLNPANVVLDVPLQLLSGGNLQAHYDQPHK
jgi:hypothetical protein